MDDVARSRLKKMAVESMESFDSVVILATMREGRATRMVVVSEGNEFAAKSSVIEHAQWLAEHSKAFSEHGLEDTHFELSLGYESHEVGVDDTEDVAPI